MTQRRDARLAGCAYLAYILFAMSSSILFAKASAGGDVSQTLSTLSRMIWTARVTVLLDLLCPVCALVLAATLYGLVKTVDPTIALLAMLFRLGEGVLGALPQSGSLSLSSWHRIGLSVLRSLPAISRSEMSCCIVPTTTSAHSFLSWAGFFLPICSFAGD